MEFSNKNLLFPYLSAGCPLPAPVLSSCWARGHYCSLPGPAAVPGRCLGPASPPRVVQPMPVQDWRDPWKEAAFDWLGPGCLLGPTGPAGAEPPEMLEPDLSSGDYADTFLWLVLLDPFCAGVERWKNSCWEEMEEARGGEKAVIADDGEHQWVQQSEQSLTVGGDEALLWRDGGEKERSECLHVSHGEQQQ